MLYNRIRRYIDPVQLIVRDTTNELIKIPKDNFEDILHLYIRLCGILSSEGFRVLNTPNHGYISEFKPNAFNYIIMSKGNLIINKSILNNVIVKLTMMVESYLESRLLQDNPQFDYFEQFNKGNFEGIEYVFTGGVLDDNLILTFEDENGELVKLKNKIEVNRLTLKDVNCIFDQLKAENKLLSLLQRLRREKFVVFKKFVVKAAVSIFKGKNPLHDGKFLKDVNFLIEARDGVEVMKKDEEEKKKKMRDYVNNKRSKEREEKNKEKVKNKDNDNELDKN